MGAHATSGWLASVPNLISGARVALALCFPFVAPELRAPVVALCGLSDAADGFIARRYGVASWLGGLLDAGADKLLTFVVLLTLTLEGRLPLWQTALLLSRDLFVVGACLVVAAQGRFADFKSMQSRKAGKATTAALFVTMLALLLGWQPVLPLLLGVTMAASFAALVDYAQSYGRKR